MLTIHSIIDHIVRCCDLRICLRVLLILGVLCTAAAEICRAVMLPSYFTCAKRWGKTTDARTITRGSFKCAIDGCMQSLRTTTYDGQLCALCLEVIALIKMGASASSLYCLFFASHAAHGSR